MVNVRLRYKMEEVVCCCYRLPCQLQLKVALVVAILAAIYMARFSLETQLETFFRGLRDSLCPSGIPISMNTQTRQ